MSPGLARRIGRALQRTGSAAPSPESRKGPPTTLPGHDDAAFAHAAEALRSGEGAPALALAGEVLGKGVRTPALAARLHALLLEADRPTPDLLATRARAAWHAGELTMAGADARAAIARHDAPETRNLLRFIESEQRTFAPGWRPTITPIDPAARRSWTPIPGRILHLVSTSRPWTEGGFAIRTHEVGRAQLAAGLDVHIATVPAFPGRPAAALEVVEGVPYHRLSPTAVRGLPADARITRSAAEFAQLALRLRPAAIQAAENASMSETTAQAALAVGRSLGIPVVLEVRGFREEAWLARRGSGMPERSVLAGATDAAAWAAADAVVTLGDAMRTEIERRGVPGDRVRVVPNAVDIDRFTPGDRDRELAAELGIGSDDVVIGYVGSLTWYEDLPALVPAIRSLAARGRPVRLLIVGDGDALPDIRSAAAAAGLGDRLLLPGWVPHERIVAVERLIDIFVVARRDQRLTRVVAPIKPIEALAVGCTLVVNDLPALTELVIDGVTGRVVPAGDAAAMVAVLEALVDDPDTRRRLAAAGAAWARSHRSWATNGELYRALFAELGAV